VLQDIIKKAREVVASHKSRLSELDSLLGKNPLVREQLNRERASKAEEVSRLEALIGEVAELVGVRSLSVVGMIGRLEKTYAYEWLKLERLIQQDRPHHPAGIPLLSIPLPITKAAESGTRYPREFSDEARNRIEAAQLRARNELEQKRNEAPWSRWGPTETDYENFRQYAMRVFLAFAEEACRLASQGWTIDRIRSVALEFLHQFTIEAYLHDGHDKKGGKLREMVSNWNGELLSEVAREFRASAEWHQFEEMLLAVAEQKNVLGRKLEAAKRQFREHATKAFFHALRNPWEQWQGKEQEEETSTGRRLGDSEKRQLVFDVLAQYSRDQLEKSLSIVDKPLRQIFTVAKGYDSDRPARYVDSTEWGRALAQEAVKELIVKAELSQVDHLAFSEWLVEPGKPLSQDDALSRFGVPQDSQGQYGEMARQLVAPFEKVLRERIEQLADDDVLGGEEQGSQVFSTLPQIDSQPDRRQRELAIGIEDPVFSHAVDYRSVRYKGREHTLTPNQATIIKILHEAFKRRTPAVGKAELLAAVESETSRVRDSFKGCPLWQTLVVSGERRGTYRLNISPHG
jgi:hypothetical protein